MNSGGTSRSALGATTSSERLICVAGRKQSSHSRTRLKQKLFLQDCSLPQSREVSSESHGRMSTLFMMASYSIPSRTESFFGRSASEGYRWLCHMNKLRPMRNPSLSREGTQSLTGRVGVLEKVKHSLSLDGQKVNNKLLINTYSNLISPTRY